MFKEVLSRRRQQRCRKWTHVLLFERRIVDSLSIFKGAVGREDNWSGNCHSKLKLQCIERRWITGQTRSLREKKNEFSKTPALPKRPVAQWRSFPRWSPDSPSWAYQNDGEPMNAWTTLVNNLEIAYQEGSIIIVSKEAGTRRTQRWSLLANVKPIENENSLSSLTSICLSVEMVLHSVAAL